jgi:hypothetical protein
VTNLIKHNILREAVSGSVSQDILIILWNLQVHCRVNKSPPLVPTPSHVIFAYDLFYLYAPHYAHGPKVVSPFQVFCLELCLEKNISSVIKQNSTKWRHISALRASSCQEKRHITSLCYTTNTFWSRMKLLSLPNSVIAQRRHNQPNKGTFWELVLEVLDAVHTSCARLMLTK